MIGDISQDLRFAFRALGRSPGFAALTIVTLALGIGACTTIFSVLNGIVLRPLPYENPGRLAMLWTVDEKRGTREDGASFAAFEDWRNQSQSFQDMAVFMEPRLTGLNLTGVDEPLRVQGAKVSPNLFGLLGVKPIVGRTFSSEEAERGDRVVVIGYQLWQRIFGGSREIAGRTLRVEDQPARVIGVMPARFQFPSKETQLWQPHTSFPQWPQKRTTRYSNLWCVVGRLKAGVPIRQAQTEMEMIARRLEEEYPVAHKGLGVRVVPLQLQVTGARLRLALWVLFGAVVFVLLIACANVASLLLARGSTRAREMAVRVALGANRARLVKQLITENTLLSLTAGLLGILLSVAGLRALIAMAPGNIPRLAEASISPGVLVFAVIISVLTVIAFGLVPALRTSAANPNEHLQEGARRSSTGLRNRRTHSLLVVLESAMAVVLLGGAGLLIRSFQNLQNVDPGFRTDHVLNMQISPPQSMSREQRMAFYREVLRAVNAIPGVSSAGVISDLFSSSEPEGLMTAEGRPPTPTGFAVRHDEISPGLFKALGVPLLKGRLPDDFDNPDETRSVIVNDTMARRLWPGEDPVGRRLKFGGPESRRSWMTVVGVVGDMRRQGLEKEPIPEMYAPNSYRSASSMDLVVHSTTDPLAQATAVQEAIRSVNKNVPVYGVTTVANRLGQLEAQRRLQTWLLTLLSALALLLATMGIYGLQYYSVTERHHEIGIRIALGAENRRVLTLVIKEGLILSWIGLLVGLALALALTRFLSSQLFGVTPEDPLTIAVVSIVLVGTALLASYIPARRATRIDPIVTLRYE